MALMQPSSCGASQAPRAKPAQIGQELPHEHEQSRNRWHPRKIRGYWCPLTEANIAQSITHHRSLREARIFEADFLRDLLQMRLAQRRQMLHARLVARRRIDIALNDIFRAPVSQHVP